MQNSPLPVTFLEKLKTLFSEEEIENIIASYSLPSDPSIRLNTLLADEKTILSELAKDQMSLQPIPWYKGAFLVMNMTTQDIIKLPSFEKGYFYLQGLSSMLPVLILDPKGEDIVLDMAAAPGSKTTQIATLLHNKGKIFANDISRERLFKLRAIIKQQGVTNTEIMTLPGEKIWQELPDYFDKVLLDAPCSMEGRFQADEVASYDHWSPKKVKELSHRQRYLLWSAVSTTKVGGTIVYSTCTLSPEENEEVVNFVVEKAQGSVSIEKIEIEGVPAKNGLTSWKKKIFLPELSNTMRILPQKNYEGFYVAKLRKNAIKT